VLGSFVPRMARSALTRRQAIRSDLPGAAALRRRSCPFLVGSPAAYAAVLVRVLSHGPGEPQSAMSLPARQQRALDRIEKTLDDPGLGLMFAIFTELAREEPMRTTERA